jgi:UDP-N-acetyl-D-mannosaminuronate dehydrogenase
MPAHAVDILIRTHRFQEGSKENLGILIFGVSYESDVNDTRYAPTQGIVSALKKERFLKDTLPDPFVSRMSPLAPNLALVCNLS